MNWDKLARLKAENLAAIGYRPLPLQLLVHNAHERILLISGGEGSGKSLVTAAEIAARYGLWRLVYIVAPKYESAHAEIDYCYQMLSAVGAVRKSDYAAPERGKRSLHTRDGALIETISSEDGPKAVTGTGKSPDILAMVEAGKQSYDVFLACRGRIARSRGTLILSGTIEESERWYPELVTRWQAANPEDAKSFIIPTWTNTILYPGGESDAEILALKRTYPPDRFLERFGAQPCQPSDAVIKEFSFVTHVREDCVFNPERTVELWIDPGYSGSHYAIEVVQFERRANREVVNVVDELYLDHATTQEAIEQVKTRPWWPRIGGGVVDVAARAHMAMPSVWEIWRDTGITLRTNRVEVAPGVELHRTFLKSPDGSAPRLFFNPICRGAFGEYNAWRRKRLSENLYGEPSDRNCDAMKAIHYGLYDHFGALGERRDRSRVPLKIHDRFREAYRA